MLSGGTANPANYSITQPTGIEGAITPKALTITGFSISKVYDGNIFVTDFGTLAFSGLVAGETANVNTSGVTAAYAWNEVGTHSVAFSGNFTMESGGTAIPANYSITQPTGIEGEITPRELTITGFSISKVYDGNNVVTGFGTLAFSGLANGETANVDISGVFTATYASANVGTHSVTFGGNFAMASSGADNPANPANYSITQPTGIEGDITPRELTITGFSISKVYDGNNSVTDFGTLAFTGLVAGETANVDISGVTATYASATVGTHSVTFSGDFTMESGGTANPDNYSITQPTGIEGDITQATGVVITKASDYSVEAYPNPVTRGQKLYISADLSEEMLRGAIIEVYSISGQRTDSFPAQGRITTVNVNYGTGVYLFVLKTNSGFSRTLRVIVE